MYGNERQKKMYVLTLTFIKGQIPTCTYVCMYVCTFKVFVAYIATSLNVTDDS